MGVGGVWGGGVRVTLVAFFYAGGVVGVENEGGVVAVDSCGGC